MTTRLQSSRSKVTTSSRPISAHTKAGFSSSNITSTVGSRVLASLDSIAEAFATYSRDATESPEAQIKKFKKSINDKILASSKALSGGKKGDPDAALRHAKDAEVILKQFQDFNASKSIDEPEFKSFKFLVQQSLADAFKANDMLEDALRRYERLSKDREFPQSSIAMVHLEMGGIYIQMGRYDQAIKCYEMGLVHLKPDTMKLIARFRHSCGVAYLHLDQFHRALSEFEVAMRSDPAIKTGFNLVLCHSILSAHDDVKDAFARLVSVKPTTNVTDYSESDVLGNQLQVERREQVRLILLAARLVSEKGPPDQWEANLEFSLEQLRKSKWADAAAEFEVTYALAFLKHRDAKRAIDVLRNIRKKDPTLMALAATNLSFLYYLEQDWQNAEKYASIALETDKYNAQALVNKGNCLLHAGKEVEAKDHYGDAIGVDSECIEALYNLGLLAKQAKRWDEAFEVFQKLHKVIPRSPEVVYQIFDIYVSRGDILDAIEYAHHLLNICSTDPAVWKRLGTLWEHDGNEGQSFQCFQQSYIYSQSDIDVIVWLGAYHRRSGAYEEALRFFRRAVAIAPREIAYAMMVAGCYKSMDMKREALEEYEKAIQLDPSNRQCLEHLIKLTSELGMEQRSQHYQRILTELVERAQRAEGEEVSQTQGQGWTGFGNGQEQVAASSLMVAPGEFGVTKKAAREGEDIWSNVNVDL